MTREKRLGRGLEALLGKVSVKSESAEALACSRPSEPVSQESGGTVSGTAVPADSARPLQRAWIPPEASVPARTDFASASQRPIPESPPTPLKIPIQQIHSSPFQPRQQFDSDELQSLSESLKAHGLLQPVLVRPRGDRYELVAGERRLRAAIQAGWSEVPVHIVPVDDRQAAELALVENLQRKDLNPLEKAASFQRYLQQFRCTQEELAGQLKIDRSTVANLLRLLELPQAVQDALRENRITQGHARALLPLGDEAEQIRFCQRIEQEGLSVRDTEALVQQTIAEADAEPLAVIGPDGTKRRPRRPPSQHLAALEQQFRAALGTRVKLSHNARGRGKLVIYFANHDEFERIREHICGVAGAEPEARAG